MNYKTKKQYRLPYFNYASSGYYFVTICSKNRTEKLSAIKNNTVILSDIGQIIQQSWLYIPKSSPIVSLDEFIIMPNHLHGIVLINNPEEKLEIKEKKFEIKTNSLSVVIRTFKAATTARARMKYPKIQIWQPRFYDRIIRDEQELQRIRNYIKANPLRWEEDRNNLDNPVV